MKLLPHSWIEKIARRYARGRKIFFWQRWMLKNHLFGTQCQTCNKIISPPDHEFDQKVFDLHYSQIENIAATLNAMTDEQKADFQAMHKRHQEEIKTQKEEIEKQQSRRV